MLAGLEHVDEGAILIDDKDVVNLAAARPRHRDGVPELRAVSAHERGTEHGLRAADGEGVRRRRSSERVRAAAKILDLEDYLDRKPRQLSGGQRQRVAMGRAIVREPRVFLMDEPLSNLDAKLRVATRAEIAALQQRLGVTTLYVTHDQVEAMTMGDRVAVMKDGVLQQCDTPRVLYDEPGQRVRRRLHRLAGDEPARRDGRRRRRRESDRRSLPVAGELRRRPVGEAVTVGLRPESLTLGAARRRDRRDRQPRRGARRRGLRARAARARNQHRCERDDATSSHGWSRVRLLRTARSST